MDEGLVELVPIGSSSNNSDTRGSDDMRPSLDPDTSSGHGPINSGPDLTNPAMEQPFIENGDADEASSPQLYPFLKLIFSLQGATMQLPSLALLAIVNDRVAIPPAYLPAYSAVTFLPHSLKPLWATLSTLGADSRSKERHIQMLLGILLAANGLTYVGTALWIPVGGVLECFVWGFLRGVTDAWSQFLTDQLLIRQAQADSNNSSHVAGNRSYQALSSIFQSHAATYSSGGSLVASVATFAVFAWRQLHKQGNGSDPPLSAAVVFALLLGSACTCFAGAAAVMSQLHVEKKSTLRDQGEDGSEETSAETFVPHCSEQPKPQNRALLFATRSLFSSKYDALSTGDDAYQEDKPVARTDSPSTHTEPPNSKRLPLDTTQACAPQRSRSRTTVRDKSDVACLLLLQILLVGGAVKGPVASLDKGASIWTAAMILLATCFAGSVLVSSCWKQPHLYGGDSQHMATPRRNNSAATIPARRLGIYLILRHSVPIAGFLVYSYIYAIFGREEPLFLQCLFMIESTVSMFANWVYGRFLAEHFHSGWKIIGLIAILSIVASLLSLLDVVIVHVANAKEEVDASLRWLVVAVGAVTYFIGQIGYMPSVILTTANVVSTTDANKAVDASTGGSISFSEGRTLGDDAEEEEWTGDAVYDEGIQYATFVACIDFGAQVGNWISVPMIAAFGIQRENHWANLDKFIVLCALMRIASVSFLYIIRPKPPSSSMMTQRAGNQIV
jgi:hypothetical protein